MVPNTGANVLGGATAFRVWKRIGTRTSITAGAVLTCGSLTALAFAHDSVWHLIVFTTLSGLGSGLTFASISATVAEAVPAEHIGVATGMASNLRTIGATVGTAIMKTIVTSHELPSGHPAEAGYRHGFLFIAASAAAVAATAFLIPVRRTQR
jgi:MFS family permease